MEERGSNQSHGTGDLVRYAITSEERDRLVASAPVSAAPEKPTGVAAMTMEALASVATRSVVDVRQYPFRAIAFLRVNVPNGFPLRGTAFFVSETLLATAAHNLPPDLISIEVFVEFDGNASSQPFVTTDFRIAPGDTADTHRDFGAVILSQNVGHATGWFVPPLNPAAPLQGSLVVMSGYPAPGFLQLAGTGPVVDVNADSLLYGIDTMRGDSGAPIFADIAPDPVLVGIHRADRGIAVPLTPQVSQQILDWIAGS